MVNILSYHEDWKIWTVAICFLKIERAAYEDIFAYMRIEKKGCIPHICGRTYAKCKAHMQKIDNICKIFIHATENRHENISCDCPNSTLFYFYFFIFEYCEGIWIFCLFKKNNEVKSTYGRLFLKIVL